MHINIEFKAKCDRSNEVRRILEGKGAYYRGRDHQIDIYFNVSNGRLKLRKGNIENSLIFYERQNCVGAKQSDVHLFRTDPNTLLEEMLGAALGIKVIVDKLRDIYFIDNVKFNIDEVQNLGSFIEVEAIDLEGTIGRAKLQHQCDYYFKLFKIKDKDLIAESYSDLLL